MQRVRGTFHVSWREAFGAGAGGGSGVRVSRRAIAPPPLSLAVRRRRSCTPRDCDCEPSDHGCDRAALPTLVAASTVPTSPASHLSPVSPGRPSQALPHLRRLPAPCTPPHPPRTVRRPPRRRSRRQCRPVDHGRVRLWPAGGQERRAESVCRRVDARAEAWAGCARCPLLSTEGEPRGGAL